MHPDVAKKLDVALDAVLALPCPNDTNGDGDCGLPRCPYCGPKVPRAMRAAALIRHWGAMPR